MLLLLLLGVQACSAFLAPGLAVQRRRCARADARLAAVSQPGLVLEPQSEGIRRQLSSVGSPVPVGAVEAPEDGWFDGATLGSCVVRRFTDEMSGDRWMMWYSARAPKWEEGVIPIATGCVGVAQSTDGLKWERLAGDERAGSCFAPNEDWWGFDTTHVGVGDVHVMSNNIVQNNMGLYWMYYFGGDANEGSLSADGPAVLGAEMAIGVALSNDGVHWGRLEGEHPSGAILEPRQGQLFVGWPQLVQMRSSPEMWHLYYHALDKASGKFTIGVATSTNCVEWAHADTCLEAAGPGRFDSGGVSARCVVPAPKGGGWLMFYEAQDDERRHSIGLATSADGLRWERGDQPVLSPGAEGAWDDGAVARPWLVDTADGGACLYYVGRSRASGVQSIGMARSEDWATFTRCATTP